MSKINYLNYITFISTQSCRRNLIKCEKKIDLKKISKITTKDLLLNTDHLHKSILCLVLLLVPKCFVPIQIFWASPKIWLYLVPLQKLLCWHKNQFYWMQIIFLSGTKCLWLPQCGKNFLVWHKKIWTSPKHFGTYKRTRH